MKSSIRICLAVVLAGTIFLLCGRTLTQAADNEFVFTIDVGEDVYVAQTVTLSGSMPGADSYEYYILFDGDEFDTRYFEDVESFEAEFFFEEAGDYEIYAKAFFGDEETESEHYHVYADYRGTMGTPVIDRPAFAMSGENYTFSVTNLEQLMQIERAWWEVFVETYDEDAGEWRLVFDESGDSTNVPESFSIPAADLEAGTLYQIVGCARATGWLSSESHSEFYVAGAVDGNVSVKIVGEDYIGLDHADLYIGDHYTIRVEAPGATAIKFFPDNGEGFYYDSLYDGEMEYYFDAEKTGTRTFFAMVSYDQVDTGTVDFESLNWGGISGTATVSVNSLGQVDAAEFDAPEAVEKGAPLPITIKSLGNAEQFEVRFVDEDGWDQDSKWFESMETPFVVNLFTGDLEVGEQYYVVINTYAPHMIGNETAGESHPLQVTEPGTEIQVTLARDSVNVTEGVSYVVYAPGAEEVMLKVLDAEENVLYESEEAEGEALENTFAVMEWEAGTYFVYGGARYPGQDTWVFTENPYTLTVSSLGTLPSPVQTWKSIVIAGTEVEYSFEAVENANNYSAIIHHNEDNVTGMQHDHAGSFTLPTSVFGPSGVTYKVEVVAFGRGYNPSSGNDHRVAIIDPGKILVLPADLTTIEEEAFAGVDAQLIVLPEGVTSVAPRAFANCPNLLAVVSPNGAHLLDDNVFEGCPNEVVIAESY